MKTDIISPTYYHREYKNDIKTKPEDSNFAHEAKRILLVALPFLGLYSPLGFCLSLSLGSLRSFTHFSKLISSYKSGDLKQGSYAFFQTTIAAISVGGTILAHPLGMLLTTVHDCALNCIHIGQDLYLGAYSNALGDYAHLVNNSLYLALFLQGGLQVAIASFAMQVIMNLSKTVSEYKKGRRLEAAGQLLMGIIRGRQLSSQIDLLQRGWQLSKKIQPKPQKPKTVTLEKPSQISTKGNIFHDIAYYVQKPVQKTSEFFLRAICTPIRPGEEGNWTNTTMEKCRRVGSVFITLSLAPVTVSLYTLGEGLHFCGNQINGVDYTYYKGLGEEKLSEDEVRCMTLNACMLWGGLPIPLGGARPYEERMEQLVTLIREENPDLLFLQEMSFPASKDLFHALEKDYAHCYTRIGPNFMRMESGLVVFSKVPIDQTKFLLFPDQNGINRGAFFLETAENYFVTAHLEAGNSAPERAEQFVLITQEIEDLRKQKEKNCYLLGDLNIDSFDNEKEYQQIIGANNHFYDPNAGKHIGTESCTNTLANHMLGKEVYNNHSEMVDYALVYGDKNQVALSTKFVDTYRKEDPYLALSDHKALVLDIRNKKMI